MVRIAMARILYMATAVVLAIFGIFLLYFLSIPLYLFRGVVDGYIALSSYSLRYYGERIYLSSLDSVRILSLPLYILSIFMILTAIYSSIALVLKKDRHIYTASEIMLGVSLASIAMTPIVIGILGIIDSEVRGLRITNVFYTSAGLVNFGSTEMKVNSSVLSYTTPLHIIIYASIIVMLSIATYIAIIRIQQRTH